MTDEEGNEEEEFGATVFGVAGEDKVKSQKVQEKQAIAGMLICATKFLNVLAKLL